MVTQCLVFQKNNKLLKNYKRDLIQKECTQMQIYLFIAKILSIAVWIIGDQDGTINGNITCKEFYIDIFKIFSFLFNQRFNNFNKKWEFHVFIDGKHYF
jgi:hypothetical protein